ncbi:MAG: divalent-cation tolerance protein CutA [Methanoregulaceae archaeon]|nr:divalent-cation tolerance protein CutA [Methanoregulaceae archaeon]
MSGEVLGGLVVVLSTAPRDAAAGMAKTLVERRLAACVNIAAVRSVYRWKGEACDEEEALMIVKTSPGRVSLLIAGIREIHPYDVPEVIVLPVTGGYLPYLEWVEAETGEERKDPAGKGF